ncbi:CHAT domain-containing protein [Roseateles sp.]|uniref:CHAT domain-containing protein n=1 Tax=Roseateles sp. TaxID=1971397 RepID=UPI0031D73A01
MTTMAGTPPWARSSPTAWRPRARTATAAATTLVVAVSLLMTATTVPAQPQFPGMPAGAMGRASPQAPDPAQLADRAEQLLDPAEAARQYAVALQAAAGSPPRLLEQKMRSLLPAYARTLMDSGQLDAADQALMLLSTVPPAPSASNGQAVGFAEAMRALNAAFDLARQNARSLNQRMLFDLAGADAAVIERALRPRLPATASPLALEADLRALQGRRTDVLKLAADGLSAERRRVDGGPPDLRLAAVHDGAVFAWHLGLAQRQVGAEAEAMEALRQANRWTREELRRFASAIDVRASGFQQTAAIAGSMAGAALRSGRPQDREAAVAELVASQGLASRYLAERRRLLRDTGGSAIAKARREIDALEAALPMLETSGAAGMMRVVEWENRYIEALAPVRPTLAQAGLDAVIAEPEAALRRVQSALAPDQALIAFATVSEYRVGRQEPTPARTLRFTVTARGVSLTDLGPRQALEQALRGWRAQRDTSSAAARETALGQQLLSELPAEVSAARRWLIDADGLLTLLPFEVLRDASGTQLLERHAISAVNHAIDLRPTADPANGAAGNELAILADPRYGDQSLGVAAKPGSLAARDRGMRDAVPAPLPETRAEAADVAEAGRRMGLQPRLLLGAEATPERLAQVRRPAILHVAAHGALLSTEPLGDLASQERVRLLMPGQLAALVLSADAQGPLFSASQLEAMDLRGTRLVVLSACDTGNGVLDPHEGLASLRHAAELAGARATLTSLWPVPSAQTARLMHLFYGAVAEGQPLAEALTRAKLQLRKEGAPASAWAGFVLSGSGT